MKQSTLYNIIEDAYVAEWKENFKTAEGRELYSVILQTEKELCDGLTDAKIEIIKRYAKSFEGFYECMIYCLAVELLHTGIKIGMEIKQSDYTD